ncbi:MAG TPA: alanine racemase [Myxococcota bacterium]|nr:alanine racemase [Myxococcota bacterium]
MGETAESEARGRAWAEIDLGALARNYRAIRARAGDKRVIAVVKANAYGHGALLATRALVGAGCDAFAVISVEEAAELRSAGVAEPVLVLGGVQSRADADAALALDVEAVVSRVEALDWLEAAAGRAGRVARFQLELDTGMGRLGVLPDELPAFLERIAGARHARLSGVMSHLACADDAASPETGRQRKLFAELVARVRAAGLRPEWVHMDNSAGIARGPSDGSDAVRPGISLYGVDPTLEGGHAGEPVMSLCARVVHAKTVAAGTPIGYAAEFRAAERTRILTLGIGYADGLPRAAGGRAAVAVRGRRAPLVGRISCDLATAAVPPDDPSAAGDVALVFGRRDGLDVPVEDLARAVGTISYEVLARIGPRVPRLAT